MVALLTQRASVAASPSDEFFPEVIPFVPVRGLRRRLERSRATLILLTLTIAVTLVQLVVPRLNVIEWLGLGRPGLPSEWWRLITYMFPQKLGVPHLLLNATGLALYGPFLERRIGSIGMTVTYMVGGVFGGAWLFGAGQHDVTAGASLALFAVIGALPTAYLVLARSGVMPRAAFVRALLIALALTLVLWPVEVASYIYEGRDLTLSASVWGIVRHSPGLIAGIPLGFAFGSSRLRMSRIWPSVAVLGMTAATLAFVLLETVPWPLWPAGG